MDNFQWAMDKVKVERNLEVIFEVVVFGGTEDGETTSHVISCSKKINESVLRFINRLELSGFGYGSVQNFR